METQVEETKQNEEQEQEQEFLSRQEKAKKIKYPTTNENQIIVKINENAEGYQLKSYESKFLLPEITQDQFMQTIRKVNKIWDQCWEQKRKEEEQEYQPGLKFILYITIFLIFLAFILLLVLVYGYPGEKHSSQLKYANPDMDDTKDSLIAEQIEEKNSDEKFVESDEVKQLKKGLLWASVSLFSLSASLVTFVVTKAFLTKPIFVDLNTLVTQKLQVYLNKENIETYNLEGWSWKIGYEAFWLELNKLNQQKENLQIAKNK